MGLLKWWGNSKGSGVEDNELLTELNDDQKQYFLQKNTKLEIESKQAKETDNKNEGKSNKKFSKFVPKTPEEIEKLNQYKNKNNSRVAMLENCSEIQQALLYCIKNGSFNERMSMCNEKTKALMNCADLQKTALVQLGFENASSIEEIEFIKGKVDDLFVKNFGNDGLKSNEGNIDEFKRELEETRVKFWS